MSHDLVRKQISILVPVADWKAIRQAAAELRIPMTELCRRWMADSLQNLKRSGLPDPAAVSGEETSAA